MTFYDTSRSDSNQRVAGCSFEVYFEKVLYTFCLLQKT